MSSESNFQTVFTTLKELVIIILYIKKIFSIHHDGFTNEVYKHNFNHRFDKTKYFHKT